MNSTMQSILHVKRRNEPGFLHFFGRENGLSAEFFHTDGTDGKGASCDKRQEVKAITATESEPIRERDWREFLPQGLFKAVDQIIHVEVGLVDVIVNGVWLLVILNIPFEKR